MQTLVVPLVATLTVAVYAAMHTIAKTQISVPPYTFIAIAMGTVALFACIAAVFSNEAGALSSINKRQVLALVLYAAVNFIGFVLYLYVIGKMPILQYQLLSILGPIFGAIIAFAILREPLTSRFLLALPFIGFGVYLTIVK